MTNRFYKPNELKVPWLTAMKLYQLPVSVGQNLF